MKQMLMALLMLSGVAKAADPQITVAWSEYPPWAALGVAHDMGIINGEAGQQSDLEKEEKVDLVLKLASYDTCMLWYDSGQVDAACITQIDMLHRSLAKKSVMFLPTSTSDGADVGTSVSSITSIEQVKKIHALLGSVSHVVAYRNLELAGINPDTVQFIGMDPEVIATGMQQGNKDIEVGMLWPPFTYQTLGRQKNSHALFSSKAMPLEVIDGVNMPAEVIAKPEGERGAIAIIKAYYLVNEALKGPDRDKVLIALGERFSKLTLQEMRQTTRDCKFFGTPEQGIALYANPEFQGRIMNTVTATCVKIGMLKSNDPISYAFDHKAKDVHLLFDPYYMQKVAESMALKNKN
jgi:hypothetical protein